jgi:hypothetical protein
MVNLLLIGIALISLVALIGWIRSGAETDSKVIDVRETADRRIEQLTVEQLHERTQQFLTTEKYSLESAPEAGDYLAHRDGETVLVRVDPAAELRDPRKMNKLILNLRQSGADSGILVTTRSVKGQSRALADKANVRIVEPEELLDDSD